MSERRNLEKRLEDVESQPQEVRKGVEYAPWVLKYLEMLERLEAGKISRRADS